VGKDIAYHMWKLRLLPDPLSYVVYIEQPNGAILWSTSLQGQKRPPVAPDRVINIIAVHQSQAQEAVKQGLQAAGFETQAEKLFHLAYGMVRTKEGLISGRKGTAAAGDDVIQGAVEAALERIREKQSQDLDEDEMKQIAEAVGVAAVRYFMVQYNPLREIVFDPADVVSFDGNTGLYVQYALVRMYAILRKAAEAGIADAEVDAADASLLQHEQERRLAFHLVKWPETVSTVSRTLGVNLLAEWAFDLATIFSEFYRDCGVLNAEPGLRESRLLLVRTVRDALVHACDTLGMPVIEKL
jgi:arginyl-tRNA synthetase